MIAMAVSCSPALIIADEATTALDTTVQREILCLFKALQKGKNISLIFISHDLSVIRQMADHLLVMYKGEIVESGRIKQIFDCPKHPYTRELISCKPRSDIRLKRLPTIGNHISQSVRETIPQSEIYTETERSFWHQKLYASSPLLTIDQLSVSFKKEKVFSKNTVKVLDQVSFEIYKGETLGLVGESGSEKPPWEGLCSSCKRRTPVEFFLKAGT